MWYSSFFPFKILFSQRHQQHCSLAQLWPVACPFGAGWNCPYLTWGSFWALLREAAHAAETLPYKLNRIWLVLKPSSCHLYFHLYYHCYYVADSCKCYQAFTLMCIFLPLLQAQDLYYIKKASHTAIFLEPYGSLMMTGWNYTEGCSNTQWNRNSISSQCWKNKIK